jgi:hypothetical protein
MTTFILRYTINGLKFVRKYGDYQTALTRAQTLEAQGIVVGWQARAVS